MLAQSHDIPVAETSGAFVQDSATVERRGGSRLRTVYRVARVHANGDVGLAKVLNISDEGLMLRITLDADIGDAVWVDLSESCTLKAKVVWREGNRCGVRLAAPIDSARTLSRLVEERRLDGGRPLRLACEKPVLLTSEQGLQIARLRDVSQSGMKLAHNGALTPGLAVKVRLSDALERRGVVRWSENGVAGISLTEILCVEELGSLKASLAGAGAPEIGTEVRA